jgi:hypothetical protein
MKTRDIIIFIVGGAIASFGCLVLYIALNSGEPSRPSVPTVAGQQVPPDRVSLNFTNRFTFYCDSSAPHRVFRECKIIGFSGETSGRGPSISSGYVYFDNWVVLENADGHRFYVRPGDIQYIEDDNVNVPNAAPITH